VLERGYAIARDGEGKVLRSPEEGAAGDALAVELAKGEIRVRVESRSGEGAA